MSSIRENERSKVIDFISYLNEFLDSNDFIIKKVGGESGVVRDGVHMFPDMLLFADNNKTSILQGWEFKMPDVKIEDFDFISDASRKAETLGLNSFVIWNFRYAVLYAKDIQTDKFEKKKVFFCNSEIKNRSDVSIHEGEWKSEAEKIIVELNEYFIQGDFREKFIGEALTGNTLTVFISRNKSLIADELKKKAISDSILEAYLSNWWSQVRLEYSNDENDKYSAYGKSILLNWANRLLFANFIKDRQIKARKVENIIGCSNPQEADNLFKAISSECDFANVLNGVRYCDLIPESTWNDILEIAIFLKNNNVPTLDDSLFKSLLESTIATSKREINGQYTTPSILAKILTRLTIKNWNGNILDCCCGTGTISKSVLTRKEELGISPTNAVMTTWAADKNSYPLQISTIVLTDSKAINVAPRIFKHNALNYTVHDQIKLVDPTSGKETVIELPQFDSIVSNLPFVPSGLIPVDDKTYISSNGLDSLLDGRSDLSFYIPFAIKRILKPNGRLGIILSNSWLGTLAGQTFFKKLVNEFKIKQVHLSGKGRWFQNANIVTTFLILENGSTLDADMISFILWKKSLNELQSSKEITEKLINVCLLENYEEQGVVSVSNYSLSEIKKYSKTGINLNSLFHHVDKLTKLFDKTKIIGNIFDVFRGSRRGWDHLFYPEDGNNKIEDRFLVDFLKNGKSVDSFVAAPSSKAFCCHMTESELEKNGYTGALEWINRFRGQVNGVNKPLESVLNKKNLLWYELSDKEKAIFFTTMNPDQRFFFSSFTHPTFINQRLIGLNPKSNYSADADLLLALLNSFITFFFMEANGFGRGLGVLDINKDNLMQSRMPNPDLLNQNDKNEILLAFTPIKQRKVKKLSEEFVSQDRINFEKVVFTKLGIFDLLEPLIESLKSMIQTRHTVKEKDV